MTLWTVLPSAELKLSVFSALNINLVAMGRAGEIVLTVTTLYSYVVLVWMHLVQSEPKQLIQIMSCMFFVETHENFIWGLMLSDQWIFGSL